MNCWNTLIALKLQRKDEICLGANVKKFKDWAISSQDPNRVRFNGHRKATRVELSRVHSSEWKRKGRIYFIDSVRYGLNYLDKDSRVCIIIPNT